MRRNSSLTGRQWLNNKESDYFKAGSFLLVLLKNKENSLFAGLLQSALLSMNDLPLDIQQEKQNLELAVDQAIDEMMEDYRIRDFLAVNWSRLTAYRHLIWNRTGKEECVKMMLGITNRALQRRSSVGPVFRITIYIL